MRLVLDTNIVLSGLLWQGTPSRLIARVVSSGAALFTSYALIDELADVLGRAKMRETLKKSGFPADYWLDRYEQLSIIVAPAPLRQLAPDPDDDWVIATAVAARADMVVTGDKPFLAMKAIDGIRIGIAADALAEISATVRRS